MNLEGRIIELAEQQGFLLPAPITQGGEDSRPNPNATPRWGVRLDRMVELGQLTEDQVRTLALQAMQADGGAPNLEATACPDSWLMEVEAQAIESLGAGMGHPGLERYQHLVLVGSGGTAQVYRAFDKILLREVALKFLRGNSHENKASILREARAQAQVEHINICKVFEVGEVEDRPFIAMQLVRGQTLTQARGVLSFHQKIAVVRDVAEALHCAHRTGLIHLDIKPGNILMEPHGEGQWRPLVTDFGLYLSADARPEDVARQRWIPLGTPPYSSPEQLQQAWEGLDSRSDIYSLGVVLYSLLAGVLPYDSSDPKEVRKRMLAQGCVPLSQQVKGLSLDLDAIVRCAMATDKRRRYATALAMAEDLDRFLRHEPVHARPRNLLSRLGKWTHRNRALTSVLLISVTVLAAWTWWYSFRARKWARLTASYSGYLRDAQFATMDLAKPLHDTRKSRDSAMGTVLNLEKMLLKADSMSRPPLHLTLGMVYQALGALEPSQYHFERAEALGFGDEETDIYLGMTLLQRYFIAVSDCALLSGAARNERLADAGQRFRLPALSYVNKFLAKNPTDARALISKPVLEGRLEEAERVQEALTRKDPNGGVYGALVVLGLNQVISKEHAERDPRSVMAALNKRKAFTKMVLEETPSQAPAYAELASCCILQAKLFEAETPEGERLLREAILHASQGAVSEPDNPEVLLALGSAFQALAENLKARTLDASAAKLSAVGAAQAVLDILPKWKAFYGPETAKRLRDEAAALARAMRG